MGTAHSLDEEDPGLVEALGLRPLHPGIGEAARVVLQARGVDGPVPRCLAADAGEGPAHAAVHDFPGKRRFGEHVHPSICVALLSLDRGGSVGAEEEVDDDFETQD